MHVLPSTQPRLLEQGTSPYIFLYTDDLLSEQPPPALSKVPLPLLLPWKHPPPSLKEPPPPSNKAPIPPLSGRSPILTFLNLPSTYVGFFLRVGFCLFHHLIPIPHLLF